MTDRHVRSHGRGHRGLRSRGRPAPSCATSSA